MKFGGCGVIVWSCFFWRGLSPLVDVGSKVTAQCYIDILRTFVLPIIKDPLGDDHCVFQHDPASINIVDIVGCGLTTTMPH